jgi:hypothetical protein
MQRDERGQRKNESEKPHANYLTTDAHGCTRIKKPFNAETQRNAKFKKHLCVSLRSPRL